MGEAKSIPSLAGVLHLQPEPSPGPQPLKRLNRG
jgi:hypothetical protein